MINGKVFLTLSFDFLSHHHATSSGHTVVSMSTSDQALPLPFRAINLIIRAFPVQKIPCEQISVPRGKHIISEREIEAKKNIDHQFLNLILSD